MVEDDLPWMTVQENVEVVSKISGYVVCDRRQHLLIYKQLAKPSASTSSPSSTVVNSDGFSISTVNSILIHRVKTIIYLERIQYIKMFDGDNNCRSAPNNNKASINLDNNQIDNRDSTGKTIKIYYSTDRFRPKYLYKCITFQVKKHGDEFNKWVNALNKVIKEAKKLDDSAKRTRWLLREFEKLKRSSTGLTFDSINCWLNSHLGIIGEKANVIKLITEHKIFCESNTITDSVFKATYSYFMEKQQEILMRTFMPDLFGKKEISLMRFALYVMNNHTDASKINEELDKIREFLKLKQNEAVLTYSQCISYLWSDANAAFDPISRTCHHDMNQPLNHYWISTSHNTYLVGNQMFHPASVHSYIQALLKGCRCIEIDVFDSKTSNEPDVTHKNTRIKPIPLRDILVAINDYAFVTSVYPVIISIENHCSTAQRTVMAKMFIEIFSDTLLQAPLSINETCHPSPDQLKRKIILKRWLKYGYVLSKTRLILDMEQEVDKQIDSDDDSMDDEMNENSLYEEPQQIWYHGMISHEKAENCFTTSKVVNKPGTFLIRKSSSKNCYCLTFLASNSKVKSIQINQEIDNDGKTLYSLAQKKFKSLPDLVAYYKTYCFTTNEKEAAKRTEYRLDKPLPGKQWTEDLQQQSWYQPTLSNKQAEELLLGIGEEMTFLIRNSSKRDHQYYTLSVYMNGSIRHTPIFCDGSDLMVKSRTFTSLIELVAYFSRNPRFLQPCVQTAENPYSAFIHEKQCEEKKMDKSEIIFKSLEDSISLEVNTLGILEDQNKASNQVQVYISKETDSKNEGYLFKFNSIEHRDQFLKMLSFGLSPSLSTSRQPDFKSSTMNLPYVVKKSMPSLTSLLTPINELDKLIIYLQSVKLRHSIKEPQHLLEKLQSFKEMISLGHMKANIFCSNDIQSMILFNLRHFTRVYPDLSLNSLSSSNFEPLVYWLAGCQLVALNFQMPDRPMHINAGRFAVNGNCGYVLMPNYIRSYNKNLSELGTSTRIMTIRILAVRHIRANQSKHISKLYVKVTLIDKQKSGDKQVYSITIYGPCGIIEPKHSKNSDTINACKSLVSDNRDGDLLYFEVLTDYGELCGQSAIPISSLRTGIRCVALYDKFNEHLDMSALLVDIQPENRTIYF